MDRTYAKKEDKYIKATEYGTALVNAYKLMGIHLYLPELRAEQEKDLNIIANIDSTHDKQYLERKK